MEGDGAEGSSATGDGGPTAVSHLVLMKCMFASLKVCILKVHK